MCSNFLFDVLLLKQVKSHNSYTYFYQNQSATTNILRISTALEEGYLSSCKCHLHQNLRGALKVPRWPVYKILGFWPSSKWWRRAAPHFEAVLPLPRRRKWCGFFTIQLILPPSTIVHDLVTSDLKTFCTDTSTAFTTAFLTSLI